MSASTLTTVELLALSKAVKADREAVASGTYQVDFTVRVQGKVVVAADTQKVPTVSIPVKEVLALFVARSGCTREASIALLQQCLTDALAQSSTGCGAIEGAVDIDEVFEAEVKKLTEGLPKTPVKGAVKPTLTVSQVSMNGVTAVSSASAVTAQAEA